MRNVTLTPVDPTPGEVQVSCGFRVTGTVDTRFGIGLTRRRPL